MTVPGYRNVPTDAWDPAEPADPECLATLLREAEARDLEAVVPLVTAPGQPDRLSVLLRVVVDLHDLAAAGRAGGLLVVGYRGNSVTSFGLGGLVLPLVTLAAIVAMQLTLLLLSAVALLVQRTAPIVEVGDVDRDFQHTVPFEGIP